MTVATVAVRAYSHAITHVTDNILRSLKEIVRRSGMNPSRIADQWVTLELGIRTWMSSEHLEKVTLEVFNAKTDAAIGFWDVTISYGYSGGDGEFWVDTDAIRYAIIKAGVYPSDADYRIVASTKAGRPDVAGWRSTTGRSRDGFVEQSIGTSVEASGLSGSISYFRRS